ncbi:thrombospondin type 3 repeat-containing protein [Marinobacterium sp. D7]|uniref:thrombospondin type 3 repeat-containing protein n=1 Tax=Marinobacterium ramblicola TaxID=2849041 RepID=UPI001C2D8C40|nr:thrombospondin type 3 repeat-containing protein [Marinobacterium ramblicola]MBV1787956.1 thrombospondin type 3 repeat-containing protein [Marinobacterium ramblicola]
MKSTHFKCLVKSVLNTVPCSVSLLLTLSASVSVIANPIIQTYDRVGEGLYSDYTEDGTFFTGYDLDIREIPQLTGNNAVRPLDTFAPLVIVAPGCPSSNVFPDQQLFTLIETSLVKNDEADGELVFVGIKSDGEQVFFTIPSDGFPVGDRQPIGVPPEFQGVQSIEIYGFEQTPAVFIDDLVLECAGDVVPDSDGDGIEDAVDNCVTTYNPRQTDLDGDGLGDLCDSDDDNDGLDDIGDNCRYLFNPDQADINGDGFGDACVDPDMQKLYAITSFSDLYVINQSNGLATYIGSTGFAQNNIITLSTDPTDGKLVTFQRLTHDILRIDVSNSETSVITITSSDVNLHRIAFDIYGALYGIDGHLDDIAIYDLGSGDKTFLNVVPFPFTSGAAVNNADVLFVIDGESSDLAIVDKVNGSSLTLFNLGRAVWQGLAFDQQDILYTTQRPNGVSYLYQIDLDTEQTTPVGQIKGFVKAMDSITALAFELPSVTENRSPVADAGADQSLECTGESTPVLLDGSNSYDPDGDALTYLWSNGATTAVAGASYTVGIRDVELTVSDGLESDTDSLLVTISDTTAPDVNAGADVSLEATSAAGADHNLQPIVNDLCDTTPVIVIAPLLATYPLGTTLVSVTASDNLSNSASDEVVVTVEDTTPPLLSVPPDMTVEGNANGAFVDIGVAVADDLVDGTPCCSPVNDAPADGIFPLGVTEVAWEVKDNAANRASGVQVITVVKKLADPSEPGRLEVDPQTDIRSSGAIGGPFTPDSQDFNLVNPGGGAVDFTATSDVDWLVVGTQSGSIPAQSGTLVNVRLKSKASTLSQGRYTGTIRFTDVTDPANPVETAVKWVLTIRRK